MYILLLPTSIFLYSVSYRLTVEVSGTTSYDGSPLFQIWYIIPNFSFGVILIDYYIHDGAKLVLGLDVSVAWEFLALATPFYLGIYMYLDSVIPNTFGLRDSPCFCLKRNKPRIDFDQKNNGEEDGLNLV